MKDKKITGSLDFTKLDFSTDETLPNTLIQIYNENDELVFEGRTDENGKITIEELTYGKYYILEKEAPEGYELNTEKMWFEIREDGEIVKSVNLIPLITGKSKCIFFRTSVLTKGNANPFKILNCFSTLLPNSSSSA